MRRDEPGKWVWQYSETIGCLILFISLVSSTFSHTKRKRGPGWLNELGSWILEYLATYTSLSPIRRGFAPVFVNYKKGCTRLAVASDKVYQLLVHGRWFSPVTPVSSTTKTGRHDIVEILLKVALNKINQIKSTKRKM